MAFRLLPIAASLAVMGQVALPGMLVGEARAQHVAATAVPQGNVTTYGNAVGYQVAAGANGNVTASITQSANTNVVNWQSFDIGRNATVSIRQPSASAVLLNNVQGGAYLGKTTIEGMLNANGRVYIYNPNGVLIGSTAQVNVDTLIASSLKFDVARVVSGLIQKSSTPVLAADLALGVPGNVEVEAGAMVNAGSQILLAAPHVVNNGSLSAPDGQVVLAAGGKVFLAAPATTPGVPNNLRGVVVEVSNDNLAGSPGSADNNGSINVGHGNATMVGYAVNQNGIVSARTSVSQNGSIFLYARDQATIPDASSGAIVPGRAGRLVLGEGSTTEVKLDTADTATLPATTAFNPSVVDLNGADIQLLENAKIVAPGGTVTLRAQAVPLPQAQGSPYTPDATRPLNLVNSVQVSMAPGSQIDVSGNTDTQLPMESNLISVNLRGTELADNPVLRDSSLYGSTVQIDARTGTAAANVTGWLNLVGHTVGELASAGGKVGISSDGAILQSAGSSIKADGGWVQYLPGYVNTSRLMLNGQLVDIGSAQSGVAYTAVVNAGDALYPAEQWQPGYVQGNHAGTIQIAAPLVALQGSLSAKATPGIYQRDVAASSATPRELSNASDSVADAGYLYFQNLSHVRPKGGDLLLGNTGTGPLSTDLRNYPYPAHSTPGSFIPSLAADVTLRAASASSAVSLPEAGTALSATEEGRLSDLNLDPTTLFTKDGFSAVRIATSGNIEVADAVTLPPGGALSLTAQAGMVLDPSGNYRQALGDIAFTAGVSGAGASVSATAANSLTVAPGLGFDLAGTWTNDQYAAGPAMDGDGRYTTPDVQRGGSLSLSANQLSIGDGVSVDVSAGAWANSAGKLAQGSGGSISFSAVPLSLTGDPFNESLHLGSGLSLKAYGFTAGGTLKLVGRNVTLGGDASGVGTNDVWLSAAFFQQGGFTSYDIEANGNLTVAANASIQPMADAWNFNAGYGTVGSGGMASVASPYRFELAGRSGVRSATHLKLQALAGQGNQAGSLLVDHGASVRLDPGATLTLLAGRQLTDYGSLIAPGGTIRLGLSGVTGFRAERSIWFGADARVIAAGSTARLFTDSGGVSSGSLLSGGSIRIGGDLSPDGSGTLLAAPGYVVAEAGSVFDVSGALAKDVQLKSGGSITPAQDLGSAGGSIEIRTSPGLLFAATLRGQGAGGAAGGSLTVDMDQGGMQTGFYAFAGPATLTITSASASSLIPSFTIKNADGSTTAGLAPGQALIVQSPNTGDWMLNDGTADGSSKKTLGMGWIAASGFRSGGFSQLAFRSPDTLAFGLGSANLSLAAQDSLILDAPYFKADVLSNTPYGSGGHTLSLSAAYVQLGTTRSSSYPTDPVLGNGKLVVNANTIELIGDTRLQGFSDAKLAAAGDVRLVGRRTSDAAGKDTVNSAQGSFGLVGNLSIQSAQTYPTTLSDFTLMALPNVVANADGSRTLSLGQLTFSGNGTTAQAPLSAAGRLNVLARDIMQGGTVLAPFGVINMGGAADTRIANPNWDANDPSTQYYLTTNLATRSLEYLPGSLTSVAGSGTVPFGTMVNGAVSNAATWNVTLPDGVSQATFDLSNPLPAKAINSVAEVVKSDAGSVLDASGGGRLVAYEFTAGRLGSSDILNNDGASATVFAIIPGFQGAVAPVDGSYGGAVKNTVTNSTYYADGNIKADGGGAGNGSDGGLKAGDSIYLSGMSGLPAGTYTLLPAHYALMAGAYTVTVRAGTQDMLPQNNSVLADGSLLVSGNRLESVSGKALGTTRSSGFVVTPQSVLTAQAQSAAAGYQKYTLYDADSYFGSLAKAAKVVAPELPTDGGSIAFTSSATGSSALVLNGTLRLGGASGGRAGSAAFSADKIEVVAAAGQGAADAVKLLAGKLTGLAAESLLIQGRSVTVSNNAATPLSAAEVTLNAAESLVLAPGAVVAGSGTLNRSPLTLPASQGGARIQATGLYADGSLPYLSIPDWATAGTPSGTLDLGAGANFGGSASVLLAAGNRVGVAPGFDLKIADGGALAVGARNPSLDADTARALSGLSSLAMDSYGTTIGLYGSFVLGSRDLAGKYSLANLSFKASGFQQHGGTDDLVALSAASVRLEGSGAPVAANPVAHGGSLTIQAGTIKLGDNGFALRGFQDAALSADGEMLAVGRSGALVADYDLTLSAARFGTANAAAGLFAAGGDLTLLGNSATVAARAGMGGKLSFQAGNDLKSTANITLPSGKISMRAGNDLDIAGGTVSAAGLGVSFADTSAYGPGGSIGLAGGNSVTLETAATLDVSATGAQAGALSIQAGDGGVTLAGQLDGRAVAAPGGSLPAQGRFSLDSSYTNGDFGALNDLLNASHFTESRTFRYRNGDVELNAGDTVTAHEVSITADNGNILVHGGTLDASGAKGGSIELYAAQSAHNGNDGRVVLESGALLDAHATQAATSDAGSTGNGGRVVIGVGNADGSAPADIAGGASMDLAGGTINVAGMSASGGVSRDGTVLLRAPRVGNDVAIARLATGIQGSSNTAIEAYQTYETASISTGADSVTNLNATQAGKMYRDAEAFAANAAAIATRLGMNNPGGGNRALAVRPGIEVRSSGDLTVSVNEFAAHPAQRGWNLQDWRFAGQPINLSLRAAGTLSILGSISDGFAKPSTALSMPDWQLATGPSASYRLVGGADLMSANPLAVTAGTGGVSFGFADRTPTSDAPLTNTDAPVALVRTGTGSIDVASGGNVSLALAKFYRNSSTDLTLDGTPLFSDGSYRDGSFDVPIYGVSIYTAGQANGVSDFTAPQDALNTHFGGTGQSAASFGSGGGAIRVAAIGDIVAAQLPVAVSDWYYRMGDGQNADATDGTVAAAGTKVLLPQTTSPLVNNWLFRQGRGQTDAAGNYSFEVVGTQANDKDGQQYFTPTGTLNTAWWSRYDYFNGGVATLGGGDVTVSAGGSIRDLAASAATSAYLPSSSPATLKEFGGGDVTVRAGGDILGGAYYAQKGNIAIRADGSLAAGDLVPGTLTADFQGSALNPILALGDGRISVTAGRNLTVESLYNPTMAEQSNQNVNNWANLKYPLNQGPWFDPADASYFDAYKVDYRRNHSQFSYFSTYTANAGGSLTAIGGDLSLSNDANNIALAGAYAIPLSGIRTESGLVGQYTLAPSSLSAVALSGSVASWQGFSMAPSPSGQLDILAADSVHLENGRNSAGLVMLDNDPALMSTVLKPYLPTEGNINVLSGQASGAAAHTVGGLHSQDSEAVHIIALAGDLYSDSSSNQTVVKLPKKAQIQAGGNIRNFGFAIQNNQPGDVTTLSAGGDFTDDYNGGGNESSLIHHTITGPGRLDLSAGGDVALADSYGLVSRGNLDNPYLASGGAGVNVVAGAKPDYSAFVAFAKGYGSVGNVSSSPPALTAGEQGDLIAFIGNLLRAGYSLSAAEALEIFRNFSPSVQYAYLQAHRLSAGAGATLVLPGTGLAGPVLGEAEQAHLIHYVKAQLASGTPLSASLALDLLHGMGAADQQAFFASHTAARDILALTWYVEAQGGAVSSSSSAGEVWSAFRALSTDKQQAFLNAAPNQDIAIRLAASNVALDQALASGDLTALNGFYFRMLADVGTTELVKLSNPAFDQAIHSLFPTAFAGNIAVYDSQIKTEQGGAIDLFAPGGSIYAGLTTAADKNSASRKGLFTVRGGDLRAQVERDFLVNQGRVFTLGGGDITLVSQYNNIDAGKGAKTAQSAPPPLMTIDSNGNVKLDVSSTVSGSGIGTLKTHADQPDSNVNLVAPRGIVDAGDAGVRSSGKVSVAASVVLNANNISAGGGISGASAAGGTQVAAPTVAAPAGSTNQTEDTNKMLADSSTANDKPASLTVEVLGYGDGASSSAACSDSTKKDKAECEQ